jgi:hypothetical protein
MAPGEVVELGGVAATPWLLTTLLEPPLMESEMFVQLCAAMRRV